MILEDVAGLDRDSPGGRGGEATTSRPTEDLQDGRQQRLPHDLGLPTFVGLGSEGSAARRLAPEPSLKFLDQVGDPLARGMPRCVSHLIAHSGLGFR